MDEYHMTLSDYFKIIERHGLLVFLTTVLIFIGVWYWAENQPQIFESKARIKIERIQPYSQLLQEFFVSSSDVIQNYVYEITGEEVLSKAVEDCCKQGVTISMNEITDSVRAERVERSDIIDIFARSDNPYKARLICKAVVNAFIRVHDEHITENARKELNDIDSSILETQEKLKTLDLQFGNKIKETELLGFENQESVTRVLNAIFETRAELDRLKVEKKYTDQHPDIVALNHRIKSLSEQLHSLVIGNREFRTEWKDYEQKRNVLTEIINYLTRRREEVRISINRKPERIRILESASPPVFVGTGKLYMLLSGFMLGLLIGIVMAFIFESLDTTQKTLIEIEKIFGLSICGIIPYFQGFEYLKPIVKEGLYQKIRYSKFVDSLFLLAYRLKRTFSRTKSIKLILEMPRASPPAEAFRTLRASIMLKVDKDNRKVGSILVTSPGPAEGKSTVSCNLAISFAQTGFKTLLVSANMRRPSIYKTFGISREPGLGDVLSGIKNWRDVVRDQRDLLLGSEYSARLAGYPGMDNLFIITSGVYTSFPSEWLSSETMKRIIKEWENEYEVVIIDGPPVLLVADSVIMSSIVKYCLLVFNIGGVTKDVMLRAIDLIQKAGGNIIGLVLNEVGYTTRSDLVRIYHTGYYGQPEKGGKYIK